MAYKKKRDDFIDLGRVESPTYEPPEEIKEAFEEASHLGDGGQGLLHARLRERHPYSPELSGGDIDAAWEDADVGEESVGGENPTPDQDIVEELGLAAGLTYNDDEPLRPQEKVRERDRHRWELDPASSEDYGERSQA
jgi:hypothetical protein